MSKIFWLRLWFYDFRFCYFHSIWSKISIIYNLHNIYIKWAPNHVFYFPSSFISFVFFLLFFISSFFFSFFGFFSFFSYQILHAHFNKRYWLKFSLRKQHTIFSTNKSTHSPHKSQYLQFKNINSKKKLLLFSIPNKCE